MFEQIKMWLQYYTVLFYTTFSNSGTTDGKLEGALSGTAILNRKKVFIENTNESVFKGTITFPSGEVFYVLEETFADQRKPDGVYKLCNDGETGVRIKGERTFYLFTTNRKTPKEHNISIGNRYAIVVGHPVMYGGVVALDEFKATIERNATQVLIVHTEKETEIWTSAQ